MRAGQLRHRVTLESPVASLDAYRQESRSWATVGTYWAFVRSPEGREAVIARQLRADVTHVVTMRYLGSTTLNAECRLVFRGRTLNILSVLNVDERRRTYELHCQEVTTP
jgi:SPP1 family predicted phage head-tail adaptor